MKYIYILIAIAAIVGCSSPKTTDDQSSKEHDQKIQPGLTHHEADDTVSYIGYIQKFEDNNFFYTDLYFNEHFNYDRYDEVAKLGDSVVFKDEETTRTRIPFANAAQHFNLKGLGRISIYNEQNRELATGQFSHIEYVENMIDASFVAVFKVDYPHISGYTFCIGNPKNDLTATEFTAFEDKDLQSRLLSHLTLNADNVWRVDHYKLDKQSVYSTISADTTAFIIETANDTHTILYKSRSSETINGLTLVSKKINGRPLLLTDCVMPETDMLWTSLLIFNGKEYETSKDQRVSN